MNQGMIWHARRLTKASIEPIQEVVPPITQSEEPNQIVGEQIDESANGNESNLDYYDNQRPGAYAITISRVVSTSSRNSESVEGELPSRTDDESSRKNRLKRYIAMFIVITLSSIILIGVIFLIQSMNKKEIQEKDKQYNECLQSLQEDIASNKPFLYYLCFCYLSDIDNEFWNVYNLAKSTRGIMEYLSEDELVQACSSTNIALLWISKELQSFLNRDVYIDLNVIQTRFLLALLYVTWNGSEWTNQAGWLTDKTFCEWYGIRCEYGRNITDIYLRQNNLRGTLDTRLGLLRTLKSLNLGLNKISGSIPVNLWSLPSLEEVQLNSNLITGDISLDADPVQSMKILNLDYTYISGIFPYSSFKNLKYLNLSFTEVSGTIPDDIKHLIDLESLTLMGNTKLYGLLPSSVTMLKMLKNLLLSFTDFTGTLPESIGNMTRLNYLSINSLKIRGLIPTTIGKLSRLNTLDLSHSALNGHIPSEIGMCTALKELYLHENDLSGNLPNELKNLVMINQVKLNKNLDLMGDFSDEVVFLSNLKYLNIHSTGIEVNCTIECNATQSGIKIISSSSDCTCG